MPKKKKFVKYQVGRDAGTGEFITLAEAKRRRKAAIEETIKKPITPPNKKP